MVNLNIEKLSKLDWNTEEQILSESKRKITFEAKLPNGNLIQIHKEYSECINKYYITELKIIQSNTIVNRVTKLFNINEIERLTNLIDIKEREDYVTALFGKEFILQMEHNKKEAIIE